MDGYNLTAFNTIDELNIPYISFKTEDVQPIDNTPTGRLNVNGGDVWRHHEHNEDGLGGYEDSNIYPKFPNLVIQYQTGGLPDLPGFEQVHELQINDLDGITKHGKGTKNMIHRMPPDILFKYPMDYTEPEIPESFTKTNTQIMLENQVYPDGVRINPAQPKQPHTNRNQILQTYKNMLTRAQSFEKQGGVYNLSNAQKLVEQANNYLLVHDPAMALVLLNPSHQKHVLKQEHSEQQQQGITTSDNVVQKGYEEEKEQLIKEYEEHERVHPEETQDDLKEAHKERLDNLESVKEEVEEKSEQMDDILSKREKDSQDVKEVLQDVIDKVVSKSEKKPMDKEEDPEGLLIKDFKKEVKEDEETKKRKIKEELIEKIENGVQNSEAQGIIEGEIKQKLMDMPLGNIAENKRLMFMSEALQIYRNIKEGRINKYEFIKAQTPANMKVFLQLQGLAAAETYTQLEQKKRPKNLETFLENWWNILNTPPEEDEFGLKGSYINYYKKAGYTKEKNPNHKKIFMEYAKNYNKNNF